ncbi:hypothetical protein [Burkholderia pseudomallei]|uniref:hypothetical protein n=1 Tax=Burkholderia pseudomallei TaxID=28450 RepID=UPI000530C11D|nr:hypothetical protein [Burkholderia pseudomallei]KGS62951.1 hypothetical protein X990_1297 [Burkholderia pseudomallei MSHR4868]KGW21754.1 hypothetical protein Y602_909 [Burkholderia pseudomallei MSHR733]RAQ86196.1 hypothetical protein A4G85_13980 [Burkholderia pseudomallei]
MARPPDNRRDEAIATIRRLCAEHGLKEGCRLARQQFADVPDGTWGRWRVNALGPAPDREEMEREARAAVAAEVRENIPAVTELVSAAPEAMPAARRALDFWRMLNELDDDARLLRDYAVTTAPDGTRKVRVPFALRDAHRMRTDLVRLALQHAEVAWSTERTRQFHDAIIAAIGEVSPDLQRAVLERLRRLNEEFKERYGV